MRHVTHKNEFVHMQKNTLESETNSRGNMSSLTATGKYFLTNFRHIDSFMYTFNYTFTYTNTNIQIYMYICIYICVNINIHI